MGINAKMVVAMMMQAGMGENSIMAALSELKPIATFGGASYFDPRKVSRIIRAKAV